MPHDRMPPEWAMEPAYEHCDMEVEVLQLRIHSIVGYTYRRLLLHTQSILELDYHFCNMISRNTDHS